MTKGRPTDLAITTDPRTATTDAALAKRKRARLEAVTRGRFAEPEVECGVSASGTTDWSHP